MQTLSRTGTPLTQRWGHVMPVGLSLRSADDRRQCWLAWIILALVLGPGLAGTVHAQADNDLFSFSKDLKALNWDWYTRDFRELTFNRMAGVSEDYRVGPGDDLQITIVGIEAGRNYRVRGNGEITVPLLGNVMVGNLTAEEAENAIASQLRAQSLVNDPQVLIYIASYEAKKFWVYGQVDRPGEYTMSQQLTVMDAIFMAGGLDFYGESKAYLHRRVAGSGTGAPPQSLVDRPAVARSGTEVVELDLRAMRNGGLLSPNPQLKDGDVVVVPTRYPTVFYVLGDVRSAGPFQVNTGERLTVTQAVSQAGGPTRTAKTSEGLLVRYTSDGQRVDTPFDYLAILNGRQPDFEIRSNDVVFIPGSSAKEFGYGLLNAVPGVIAAMPYVK